MIISIDAEKVLAKIQHPFMTRKQKQKDQEKTLTLTKVVIEGTNITHRLHNTQWCKAKTLPAKIWNKTAH